MLCALTVRTLKPVPFERFREVFTRHEDLGNPPVELHRTAAEQRYPEQLETIAALVESVGADGLHEVVEDHRYGEHGRLSSGSATRRQR